MERVQMVRLAYVLTSRSSIADEIVQEAFLKVHLAWTRLDNPVAYLRTTVVNGCHSYHRRRGLEERALQRPPEPTMSSPDELSDAIAKLPQRQRTALALRYFCDLPDREIAAHLNARPATVRSLISRGLENLRKEIER
jgi:RNA polymerase sigma factor (sigma-70 family)